MRDVSVVIPVYNRCDLLRKTLLSLANQSHPPREIIITDDGSSEDVRAALEASLSGLPGSVGYVVQPRNGFRAARCRNNGIRYARSDIIILWDQDIIATRGYVAAYACAIGPRRFVTGYPVRLTEAQTAELSDGLIGGGRFEGFVTGRQRSKIARQFAKDLLAYHARKWHLSRLCRPKLRSGVSGVWREDLLLVDGFDENYEGWGNEDDDLGRRLYALGARGRNVCLGEYPLHLHHAPHHRGGFRRNRDYARIRARRIGAGDVRAVRGLSSRSPEEHHGLTWLK
ncbi:MAG: glycosyltransferase [Candidatus Eisenbacteria bacterium]|jgi:glycosyltransferase involved in cell wall biosynthesis|nr:glycosyltransferase [Candidatus Eisenbacteria bacterium]